MPPYVPPLGLAANPQVANKTGSLVSAFARGEMEIPNSERDMAGWAMRVYPREQQERLGSDETGQPLPVANPHEVVQLPNPPAMWLRDAARPGEQLQTIVVENERHTQGRNSLPQAGLIEGAAYGAPPAPPYYPVPERPLTPRGVSDQATGPAALVDAQYGLGGVTNGIAASSSVPFLNLEGAGLRSRSQPMTPTGVRGKVGQPRPPGVPSGVLSTVSPYNGPVNYAATCQVWPPPPLPPVNCELSARLEALEAQRISSIETMRDRRIQELSSELSISKAATAQCKTLEAELEKCNKDWKEKCDALEERLRANEGSVARRIDEAIRDVELRAKEEHERLRLELQAVRGEDARARDAANQRAQAELERLRSELQVARDVERRTRDEAQQRELDGSRLRREVEELKEEVSRAAEQLRTSDRNVQELTEQLEVEKDQFSQHSSEIEELRKRLRIVSEQRDQLDSDVGHLKRANAQRDEECLQLRASVREEQNAVKLLQKEIETRKAEASMAMARAKLTSDSERIRRLSGEVSVSEVSPMSRATSLASRADLVEVRESEVRKASAVSARDSSSSAQMFDVDLTSEQDLPISRNSMGGLDLAIGTNGASARYSTLRVVEMKAGTIEAEIESSDDD